jgi:hypothetical protein
MKKRLPFLFVFILLLSSCFTHADGHDAARDLTINIEVGKSPALSTSSTNVTPVKTAVAISPTIELKNPTFQELRDFILKDPTSRSQFVLNKYECRHFAAEVDNNAEAEGLRCAFVLLCFEQGQHAVVAFDTTDRGLVYIEPQTDAAIEPKVGGKYQGKEIKEILIAW